MNRMKKYKILLIFILVVNLIAIITMGYVKFKRTIPNQIHIFVNREECFDFSLPIQAHIGGENTDVLNIPNAKIENDKINFDLSEPFTIQSSQAGNYTVDLKLFGLFKIKEIKLDVIEDMKLVPSGLPIGIYVETNGVLVLGTGAISGEDGMNYEPALNILKSGDYITAVNKVSVSSIEEIKDEVQKSEGKDILVSMRRNEKELTVKIKPVKSAEGEYKIGTWIRDNTKGIGTLTYTYTDHYFGALGHGITDIDTGLLMEIKKGEIYKANILKIVKGESGKPGELVGLINLEDEYKLGDIYINSTQGIFGTIENENLKYKYTEPIPIGLKQEIKLGKASILCQVDKEIEEYEIEIVNVEQNSQNHSKGLVIQISDERLLDITNGIVQGMSGSPIIQNGKLIGSVTHVFIQDSTKGYGTFIENMLNNSY